MNNPLFLNLIQNNRRVRVTINIKILFYDIFLWTHILSFKCIIYSEEPHQNHKETTNFKPALLYTSKLLTILSRIRPINTENELTVARGKDAGEMGKKVEGGWEIQIFSYGMIKS